MEHLKAMQSIYTLFFVLTLQVGFAQTYNVTTFGAKGDGKTLNTRAIQTAIDRCFSQGGGEVIVPAGKYYTGTLFLKSRVYLHLMPGAVIQGSSNPLDYPEYNILAAKKFSTIIHNGLFVETMKALIIADQAEQVGIIGKGTVQGSGDAAVFKLGVNTDGRPKNLFFLRCTDVLLRDVHILNAAQITISVSGCKKVNLDGIFVQSKFNYNCDGIDVDAQDVTISNCIIDSEDDALCFKSEYLDKFCENISVSNCVISSLCNAIKLGTGSRAGFRNITVNNCVVKKPSFKFQRWKMTPNIVHLPDTQSVNCGIVVLGVDGGLVENIHFSNIVMTDVLSPIFVRVGKRFLNPDQQPSVMRNISIHNIRAECRSIIPSIIAGLEESPIEQLELSDLQISIVIAVGADSLKTIPSIIPENLKGYPENRQTFGMKLPSNAFYVRHVKGLSMRNITVHYPDTEARPTFYFDDTKAIKLKNVLLNGHYLETKPALLVQKDSEAIEVIH
ncbi:glycoside hydrolase family 28 protein [Haliscomenobacter sp.]|uniref:glycoside hydrolase family 28 protein n=1 Tax=Haliscomenobacter sp. TaxID=2717303 RepID=UPI003BA8ACF6